MVWDPFGTIGHARWMGGGQWAGKSTVARLLAFRHGLTAYHYDYHDARGHNDRRMALRLSREEPPEGPSAEDIWVHHTPAEMAARTLAGFADRFEWVLDDLRALVSPHPVLAEGWGLRPELVAPLLDNLRRMVVLVPTEEFRLLQLSRMPRASTFTHQVSDPELAQRNRLERDRLIAADAVDSAHRLGIRVIEVDGSLDAEAVADEVGRHFEL
ncbi:hypothetical protein [Kutzneria sp. CA-103260]|uniref:hypothetical protein n=1 Tax=Kutzneria sp. CA-103260 TaxID=2802641 RepID=UPI001BA987D7|nr:hypothetical protein [Kutzneria sp. CA-103260]QUQ64848.1 hypothetical protein JJ691_25690 [Kutzneria sp. CA-103260]